MKLQRIKCPPLAHAWDLTVSPSYVVGCTGKRAVILDRQYNLLQTVEGLDYVYKAHLSPDEKQLLLISNANKFYVTDIAAGTTRKVLVRAPFNYNLEGEGCWSHDGQYVFIPVMHKETLIHTLRRYRVDTLTIDAEFLHGEYVIERIQQLKETASYFMTGLIRSGMQYFFIHLKDDDFSIYPVEGSADLFPLNSHMCESEDEISLPGHKFYGRYTLKGKLLEKIDNPFPSGESAYKDSITKHALSQCGRYIFMSTNAGFYLLDADTKQLLAHIPEEYGVQNFEQLEPDVIALAAWDGVKLYRMTDE